MFLHLKKMKANYKLSNFHFIWGLKHVKSVFYCLALSIKWIILGNMSKYKHKNQRCPMAANWPVLVVLSVTIGLLKWPFLVIFQFFKLLEVTESVKIQLSLLKAFQKGVYHFCRSIQSRVTQICLYFCHFRPFFPILRNFKWPNPSQSGKIQLSSSRAFQRGV